MRQYQSSLLAIPLCETYKEGIPPPILKSEFQAKMYAMILEVPAGLYV